VVKLGYNSNSFRSHRLLEVLPWLADLGYQAVAISPDVGCLDPAETEYSELEKVGRLCDRLGLAVVVETGARYILDARRKHRPNLLEVDEQWRQRLRYLMQMLDWCQALGSSVLSFWSGELPPEQSKEAALQQFERALESLRAKADSAGVSLGLEPEPGHWIGSVGDWAELRQKCAVPFEMTLDIGHLLVSGEVPVEALIRQNAGSIVNVHVDDMRRGVHHHLALGEGEISWPPVVAALNELPADLPACLELSRDSYRFHELAGRSISFLSDLGLIKHA